MAAEGTQFSDWYAVSRDDECLTSVQPPHDFAALVSQLSLGNVSRHDRTVAQRATAGGASTDRGRTCALVFATIHSWPSCPAIYGSTPQINLPFAYAVM